MLMALANFFSLVNRAHCYVKHCAHNVHYNCWTFWSLNPPKRNATDDGNEGGGAFIMVDATQRNNYIMRESSTEESDYLKRAY